MDRIDGFIDLDKILNLPITEEAEDFKDLGKRIMKNNTTVITKNKWPLQFNFRFSINGEKYFFGYDKIADPYIELIIEEIAQDLNIPYVSHDLAKIGAYRGVISKNYKVEGAKYIKIYDILKEFYERENPNPIYEYPELQKFKEEYEKKNKGIINNNLEGIWFALEDRYKNRDDMQEIVSKIMRKIVDVFALDIITGQIDRNASNLEIVEYRDGFVDLQPIFDNGRAMVKDPYEANVWLTVDHDYYRSLASNIERFRRFSSSEFKSIILSFFPVISEDSIKNILTRIEKKIGCELDDNIKERYLWRFKIYYEFLQDELNLNIGRN